MRAAFPIVYTQILIQKLLTLSVAAVIKSKYNVITVITRLVSIGNSRGVRIPKPLLSESGIGNEVELQVKKGEIRIVAVSKKGRLVDSTLLLSENALATDWNRPEEDEAWVSLQ